MINNEIVIDGKMYKIPCQVVHDPKLQFTALAKRTETRVVVNHLTGGEGGGDQVFNTLKERNLHVQFCIDQQGVIYQYCDAALRCSHAGTANSYSVGIEIANRGNDEADHKKWPRTLVPVVLRGQHLNVTDFYPEQYESAYQLTKKLTEVYGLPMDCPRDKNGKVLDHELTDKELSQVRGFIGHFHITSRKVDPYPKLLQSFLDHK